MIKLLVTVSIVLSLLAGGIKFFIEDFNSLKLHNTKLQAKNNSLIKQHNNLKEKIKNRNKHILKRKVEKIKEKVAKASTSSIPIVGNVLGVSLSVYEIKELCDEIQEYKDFESKLFPNDNENMNSKYELSICGIN